MKYALGLIALILLSLPVRAETVDYSLTVQGSVVGDFAWELQTDGFIQPPSPPIYQCIQYCDLSPEHWISECVSNCNPNFFNNFVSVSPPSNGDGCGIAGAYLFPDYGPAPFTVFSPLCDGSYEGFSGGAMPPAGELGTWSWNWDNGDGTFTSEVLSITDPPSACYDDEAHCVSTPEPHSLLLLVCGLGVLWIKRKVKI